MRLVLTTFAAAAALSLASAVSAQSWRQEGPSAYAPAAISGDPAAGLQLACQGGTWLLYWWGLPSAEGAPVSLIIDTQRFDTVTIYGDGSDAVPVDPAAVSALKSGSRLRLVSAHPTASFDSTFALRGSSRAIAGVEAACPLPTPAAAPDRFFGPPGPSHPEGVEMMRGLLAPTLAQMRQEANKPDIDVLSARGIQLASGLRFLIADIGASNYHFGFSQNGTTIWAQPPGAAWQQVIWLVSPASMQVDLQLDQDGWPDILLRRQGDPADKWFRWRWTGTTYARLSPPG